MGGQLRFAPRPPGFKNPNVFVVSAMQISGKIEPSFAEVSAIERRTMNINQ
jgi:hypothetical protein